MKRMFGLIKVCAVLAADAAVLHALFHDWAIVAFIVGAIALYVWLGGYLALFKEGAVRYHKLPFYESNRLKAAKEQLVEDVKRVSSVDISGLKVYLIPGDDDMQATAYGANCVSVAKGTLDNADVVTLNAVLGHEISHILRCDPEFNRAVFASVTLLIGAISVVSAVFVVLILVAFLVFTRLRSWFSVMAFRGTTKMTGGLFRLIQCGIVVVYRTMMGVVSRHAEFQSDAYSYELGYGVQLAHFLEIAAPDIHQEMTITEALYRSHPPTQQRIAHLERKLYGEIQPKY